MGLKIKAGMAFAGIALSWFCGIPFLSGIASHLDTTGNVMVDIADGIGLVSKGIEALENYLDPPKPGDPNEETVKAGLDPPLVVTPSTTEKPTQAPPPIVWRKGKHGKDIHYDPAKDRVLQKQLIQAERQKILQEYQSGSLPVDTIIPKNLYEEEHDEFDDLEDADDRSQMTKLKKAAAAIEQARQSKLKKAGSKISTKQHKNVIETQKSIANSEKLSKTQRKLSTPEILDPINPKIDIEYQENTNLEASESEVLSKPSGWKLGTKRILGSLSSMFGKINSLILKLVATIFPWNRRARRRLANIGEDDDEL